MLCASIDGSTTGRSDKTVIALEAELETNWDLLPLPLRLLFHRNTFDYTGTEKEEL